MNCNNRKIIRTPLLLFLILMISFCSWSASATPKIKSVTIQLNWKNQFQFAGFYVAKEFGFYQDSGLDVAIREYDSTTAVVQDVISKKAQFGVGGVSLILESMKGVPVTLLSAIFQHSPHVLLSKKRGDLQRVSDLKGKRIMVGDDAANMAAITAMLIANGIRKKDYISQTHTFNIEGLIADSTDAISSYISNEPYQMTKRGLDYTVLAPRDQGFDFYSDILFTSRAFYQENPELVARFNQASLKGWNWAFSNIDAAVDLILKKYNTQNRSREALLFEANKLKELAYDDGITLGSIQNERIQQIAQVYRLLGMTNKSLNMADLVFTPAEKSGLKLTLTLTVKEQNWLKGHPVIRVHSEKDWPPFNYFEYDTPRGLSIDYMNLLADQLDLKVEYVTGPSWNEFLGMIKKKELDLMLNIVKTEDLEKYLLYTPPYIRNPNVIVSAVEDPYDSMSQLFGKTVAIPKGYYQQEILTKSFPQIKILLVEDLLSGLKAVSFGKADATLGEQAVLGHVINQNMVTGLKVSGEIDFGNPDLANLHIGIRNDWPILQSVLTKAMAEVTPQQMNEIQRKWIQSTAAETKQSVDEIDAISHSYLLLLAGVVVAVGIILFLISWLVSRSKTRDISELYNSSELKRAGLIIIALSIGIIVLVASLRLIQFKEEIQIDLKNSLQTVLNESHQMLRLWVAGKKRELKIILKSPGLKRLVQAQLLLSQNNRPLNMGPSLGLLQLFFNEHQNLLGNGRLYLVSPDMVTIGAVSDQDLGRQDIIGEQQRQLLQKVFLGEVVMIPPVRSDIFASGLRANKDQNRAAMFFAGPVRDGDGNVIAILVYALDPLGEFSSIAQSGRLGKTGETYLFDEQGLLLTESRFNQDLQKMGLLKPGQFGILNIKLVDPGESVLKEAAEQPQEHKITLTLMAKEAISGRGGTNIKGYKDYRGIMVAGAWLWDHELGTGLATEIDRHEAFNQYVIIRNTLIITLGITVLIALILTGFSLWIGQSATRSLTHAKDQLEKRVQERTTDLTRLEKRFRDLLESAPDSMIIVDESAVITLVNAQTEKLFGYSRDELIGQEIEAVIPHRFRAEHPAKRNGFIKDAKVRPLNVKRDLIGLRKNGEEFPVEVSLSPLKTDEGLLVSAAVRDITDRFMAEAALKESEEKTRLILDSVGEGIFGVDLQGETMFINPAACSILGYTDDELLGKKIHALIHHTRKDGSDYPVDECPMKKAYVEGNTYTIEDEVLWRKDGTPLDVLYTSVPIIKDDQIVGAVITFQDVAEKRKAEEELKASEARFRAYFEYSQVGMAVTHPDKGWQEVNGRLLQMLGYTFEELQKLNWADLTHPEDLEADLVNFQKILDGEINYYFLVKRFIRKDGEVIHVDLSVSCTRDPDGNVSRLLASFLDVTITKNAEQELKTRFEELERFRRLAIGRELKMIGLKKEINESLIKDGREERYKIHLKEENNDVG